MRMTMYGREKTHFRPDMHIAHVHDDGIGNWLIQTDCTQNENKNSRKMMFLTLVDIWYRG